MRLANNLAMDRKIVDVVYFTSPTDQMTDAANYQNQQRFFAALKDSGVTLKLGKLVRRHLRCKDCEDEPLCCKRCGTAQTIKIEKSVDVQIVVDMIVGAMNDLFDVVYLASCDSDLIPAISHIRGLGKSVFMLLPHGAKGYAVSRACNTTIPITQDKIFAAQSV